MSKIILVGQGSPPATPSAGNVAVYAGEDGEVYKVTDAGKQHKLFSSDVGITKNVIIGGDFSTNPWQRGTSFTSIANSTYTADRWKYSKSGDMVHDITRSADGPSVAQCGALVTHCLMVDCGTVDSSIAAGDRCHIDHLIEGYNFIPLAQKPINLSFWHKHTKTGIYSVGFRNSASDRSFVAEYTQAVSDAWEFASIPILASPAAGTWDYTNGVGLILSFMLAAGSNFTTSSLNTWNSNSLFASSNQVNACDSTANNFRLARVQLEPGEYATEFEARTVQQELALSLRYFRRFPHTSAAAAVLATGIAWTTGEAYFPVIMPVVKRAAPTISYSNGTSTFEVSFAGTTTYVATTNDAVQVGRDTYNLSFLKAGSFTAGQAGTANLSSGTDYIYENAEL